MKKTLLILALALGSLSSMAQQNWLWPISEQRSGENIIYAPQSFIDGELNFDDLFIGAPHGAVVVAPADGVVRDVGASYDHSLVKGEFWGFEVGKTFNSGLADVRKSAEGKFNPQFINGFIGISLGDGLMLHINGLEGDKAFKTGQKILRGDTLGTVAYCFHKIPEPSISLSVSKNTIPADPMAPFGLKSSFIPAKKVEKIDSITKAQAKEDLDILFGATEELLPTLGYLATPQEFLALKKELEIMIDTTSATQTSTGYFRSQVLRRFNQVIHDSHIYVFPYNWEDSHYHATQPQAFLGWEKDTLRLYVSTPKFSEHIGKQVIEYNGMSADSARKIAQAKITSYDADVRSMIDFSLAFNTFPIGGKGGNMDLDVLFADSTRVFIPAQRGPLMEVQDVVEYLRHNKHNRGWASRMLNDSTALLELSTFSLNQVAVEDIGKFVDSVQRAGIDNFIVDVRNNPGGDIVALEKIFSYFATDTTHLHTYSHVKRIAGYKYLDYSLSYTGIDTLFAEFSPIEGREGFYANYNQKSVMPDSVVNYTGRLYVLTNERSVSAATEFAGYAVRAHRGVVIGRETQSAYHYLTAMKYADIRLPNSTATIRIPMVEQWFDTVVNERVPFGRGVIPDYEIRLTHDELLSRTEGDTILNTALDLIARGVYLSEENPFDVVLSDEDSTKKPASPWMWLALGGGIILLLIAARRLNRKSTSLTENFSVEDTKEN